MRDGPASLQPKARAGKPGSSDCAGARGEELQHFEDRCGKRSYETHHCQLHNWGLSKGLESLSWWAGSPPGLYFHIPQGIPLPSAPLAVCTASSSRIRLVLYNRRCTPSCTSFRGRVARGISQRAFNCPALVIVLHPLARAPVKARGRRCLCQAGERAVVREEPPPGGRAGGREEPRRASEVRWGAPSATSRRGCHRDAWGRTWRLSWSSRRRTREGGRGSLGPARPPPPPTGPAGSWLRAAPLQPRRVGARGGRRRRCVRRWLCRGPGAGGSGGRCPPPERRTELGPGPGPGPAGCSPRSRTGTCGNPHRRCWTPARTPSPASSTCASSSVRRPGGRERISGGTRPGAVRPPASA